MHHHSEPRVEEIAVQDPDFADWEEPTRDVFNVIREQTPRGVGHESWRRARCWGLDEPDQGA
jgi:hypothetical protein